MSVRPSATVVVCAYTMRRWDQLVEALESAAGQEPAPGQLLLVVDHHDALLARARAELAPRIGGLEVVANRRRPGLSGARNTAVELARGEVVAFLDDDATAAAGWLPGLLDAYADPAVLGSGGTAAPVWPEGRSRPASLPATRTPANHAGRGELDWVVGCTYAGQPAETAPVRNLMGCSMSLRRDVFAHVGGFSEDLGRVGRTPLGCEETELCLRAAAAFPGGRFVLEPGARVRHQVSPDRLTWSYLRRRGFAEGVSKALVATLAGPRSALSAERDYVDVVLRQAVLARLRRPWRVADLAAAYAVLLVLAATALGYARGRLGRRGLTVGEPPRLALRPAGPVREAARAPVG